MFDIFNRAKKLLAQMFPAPTSKRKRVRQGGWQATPNYARFAARREKNRAYKRRRQIARQTWCKENGFAIKDVRWKPVFHQNVKISWGPVVEPRHN